MQDRGDRRLDEHDRQGEARRRGNRSYEECVLHPPHAALLSLDERFDSFDDAGAGEAEALRRKIGLHECPPDRTGDDVTTSDVSYSLFVGPALRREA